MAVVQISKIQIRRGLKNSGNGVPQLASGEMAWAIDSQELYIGNGSVSEGSPYVGNTKIVTENDNLLELASSYHFAEDSNDIGLATARSLQSKLDERVSVADFGAVNDGSTDCTQAFQNAFTDLFRNTNTDFRKTLFVPNGDYLFADSLKIPSNVILEGETKDNVHLNLDANNIVLLTETGSEIADFSSSNRPENITIKNLTINFSTGQFAMSGLSTGFFENVAFIGEYDLGQLPEGDSAIGSRNPLIAWENNLLGTRVTDVDFHKCDFKNSALAISVSQTDDFETKVDFRDCLFRNLHDGIYIDGIQGQSNAWKIENTTFELIHTRALHFTAGGNTVLDSCRFVNVGNGIGSSANPENEMVLFQDTSTNVMIACQSDRIENAGLTTVENTPGIPEILGASRAQFINRIETEVFLDPAPRVFCVLGSDVRKIELDYSLTIGESIRFGKLKIMIVEDKNLVNVVDEYDYVIEAGGNDSKFTNFVFSAALVDNVSDDSSVAESVNLRYTNPLDSAEPGNLSFSVSYGQ